jgi:CheY-like chemotaxis protein
MQPLEAASQFAQGLGAPSLLVATMPEVLYIDSNRDDVELTQLACQHIRAPLHFRVARSAEQGITELAAALTGTGTRLPNLILLEVLLDGRQGFAVMEFIRSKPRLWHVPLVVYTAASSPEVLKRVQELGASSVLKKGDFLGAADKLWRWVQGQAMSLGRKACERGAWSASA